jgi:hypothetical protein
MSEYVIGIDPGIAGALALVSRAGELIEVATCRYCATGQPGARASTRRCWPSCWPDGMREKSSANSSLRGPEKALQAPSALVAAVSSSAAPSFTQP